jgi:hypothetical protein
MTDTKPKYATERGLAIDADVISRRADYLANGGGENVDKVRSLMRFMGRQDVAKFCVYHEIFNLTANVTGSIVECGVFHGNSLMTWANLSAALEPYNHYCRVIGLDTFAGYPSISEMDTNKAKKSKQKKVGGFYSDSYEDLKEAISIFDVDRPLGHIPKVELVKGDITKTAHQYIEDNPHLMVRVLSITTNIHDPIKESLKAFIPRMPKGSALIIDTLNSDLYPGATLALLDELNLSDLQFVTPAYYCNLNYAIL